MLVPVVPALKKAKMPTVIHRNKKYLLNIYALYSERNGIGLFHRKEEKLSVSSKATEDVK